MIDLDTVKCYSYLPSILCEESDFGFFKKKISPVKSKLCIGLSNLISFTLYGYEADEVLEILKKG